MVSAITKEIFETYGWHVSNQNKNKIVAKGYGIGKDIWRFFRSTKVITIVLHEDHFLLNCIIEPPVSTRYSFGHNKRIMQEFENQFYKRAAVYPVCLKGKTVQSSIGHL